MSVIQEKYQQVNTTAAYSVSDLMFLSDSTGNKSHVAEWDILEKITDLLSDRCKEVQVASAITLFAMNRATEKVGNYILLILS